MSDVHARKLTTVVAADIAGYSRLTAADEQGTLDAPRAHRSELIDPAIAEHRGRIANTAGDSILMEFPSAAAAVHCAVNIQRGIAERNRSIPESRQILFRIGVNLGDVIQHGDDLLGDGVNIAARLEALTPPGCICVSEVVRDALGQQQGIHFEDLGPQRLKNMAKPIRAYLISGSGGVGRSDRGGYRLADQSAIRYLSTPDGVSIAHAEVGRGFPLVFGACWMTHLEKDWESPMGRHFLTHLSKSFSLIRYDQRGNGMSDWDDVEITFERMIDDLECVIDHYGYEQVAIFGA